MRVSVHPLQRRRLPRAIRSLRDPERTLWDAGTGRSSAVKRTPAAAQEIPGHVTAPTRSPRQAASPHCHTASRTLRP